MQSEKLIELDNTKIYTTVVKKINGSNSKNVSVSLQKNVNTVAEAVTISPSSTGNYKSFTESDGLYRGWIYIPAETICNNLELESMVLEGEYTLENAPAFEKYGICPSTKFKAEVEGICGDINLKVQNKNLIELGTLLKGFTDLQTGRIRLVDNSISYYFETRKLPDKITMSGENVNRSNVSYYDEIPKINVQSSLWDTKNHMESSRTILVDKQYKYILIQFTYGQNATDIQVEEGTKVTAYAEHKEKNFVISLGNKTLYKGDKIIHKNGKWYFSYIWKTINNFSRLSAEGIGLTGKRRGWLPVSGNFKITDKNNNKNGGMSNVTTLARAGQTYNGQIGFTVGNIDTQKRLFIYLEELSNIETSQEFRDALVELGAYFVLPLEEQEFEPIENETLINQLDKILLNLYEYDDETNFDFDNNVIFEIEVEKDNIRLLNSRLDELEKQSITTSALALESED